MNDNTHIEMTDTAITAMLKMIEGNPGAASVLNLAYRNNVRIDPDNVFGEIGPLFSLDTLGIYGSRIWMLYKDVCGQDITNFLGILRANQLGFLAESDLLLAIDGEKELW